MLPRVRRLALAAMLAAPVPCRRAAQCQRVSVTCPFPPLRYLILNVALSYAWSQLHPDLPLPAEMLVDYVRVWQRPGAISIGCSPPEAPTQQFIACNRGKFVMSEGDELLIQGTCPQ